MREQPPLRMHDARSPLVPRSTHPDGVHPNLVLVPGLVPAQPSESMGHPWSVERCEEKTIGLEKPMEFDQPRAPMVRQVREYGNRVDEIKVPRGKIQGRRLRTSHNAEWRRQVLLKPPDAALLHLAAPKLYPVGIVDELT
jgi:hypothetical protein